MLVLVTLCPLAFAAPSFISLSASFGSTWISIAPIAITVVLIVGTAATKGRVTVLVVTETVQIVLVACIAFRVISSFVVPALGFDQSIGSGSNQISSSVIAIPILEMHLQR